MNEKCLVCEESENELINNNVMLEVIATTRDESKTYELSICLECFLNRIGDVI